MRNGDLWDTEGIQEGWANITEKLEELIRARDIDEPERIQRILGSEAARNNIVLYIFQGCPRIGNIKEPADYEIARLILGDDFISPKDIEEIGVQHGKRPEIEELALAARFPSESVLMWCCENGYVVAPDIYNDVLRTKWVLIRETAVPDTFGKDYDDQVAHLTTLEYVPREEELVSVSLLYKKVRGITLFKDISLRTSSRRMADGKSLVFGGPLDREFVSDKYADENLALPSARIIG